MKILDWALKKLDLGPGGKVRSPLWPGVRARHLAAHPTCAACGGTTHLEVHHVEPFHLRPEKELDPANLITLCESPGHNCHFLFGHLLDWKAFNPAVRLDAAVYLQKVGRRPYEAPK